MVRVRDNLSTALETCSLSRMQLAGRKVTGGFLMLLMC
jgi:hypothetical protein